MAPPDVAAVAPKVLPVKTPIFSNSNDRDWLIENYCGDNKKREILKIDEPKLNHNVCIRDSSFLDVVVSKKINNVTIENCRSVNVVVENVISCIEIIRCQKANVQITGTCHAMTLDNSHGLNVYLSLPSKNIQITTSQVQDVNLHVPESEENADDQIVVPIPCQYVHTILEGTNSLSTKVSDLYH